MLVSAVIPTYNAEQWIADTLDSVIQQTYSALEIVIVDDGSRDSTVDIVEQKLRNSGRPYSIITQANSGPGRARNAGWQKAKGSWIQFLDDDDYIHPRKIEWQMAAAADCGADIAFLFSDWAIGPFELFRSGQWERRAPRVGVETGLEDILAAENFVPFACSLTRKAWLAKGGGFDETMRIGEDVEFQARIAIAGGRFLKMESAEPLFWYRVRKKSLCNSDQREFVDACVRHARIVHEHMKSNGGVNETARRRIADVYAHGNGYYAGGDWPVFEKLAAEIVSLCPGYQPQGSRVKRLACRLLGYRREEILAWRWRQLKALWSAVRSPVS